MYQSIAECPQYLQIICQTPLNIARELCSNVWKARWTMNNLQIACQTPPREDKQHMKMPGKFLKMFRSVWQMIRKFGWHSAAH